MADLVLADSVVVVGGFGTMNDADEYNGGGAIKTVWDSTDDPTAFIGTNGGPIQSSNAATYTNSTNTFAATGIGTDVVEGTIVYLSDDDGTAFTTGRYSVSGRTNDTIVIADITSTGDSTTCTVNVGGAIGKSSGYGLQAVLDDDICDASTYNRYVYFNGDQGMAADTVTIDATIEVDFYSGTTSTRLFVIGYAQDLLAEAEMTLATISVIDELVLFTAGDYSTWRGIDFDADSNEGNNAADYCVRALGNLDGISVVFENCKFHNATVDGVNMRTNILALIGCELYDNNSNGYDTEATANDSLVYGCSIHNNGSHGLRARNSTASIVNNLIYDNTGDGINNNDEGAVSNTLYLGNTIFNNDVGVEFDPATVGQIWINNCFVGNSGIGVQLNAAGVGRLRYWGYNLSADNTGGDISDGHDFATFGNGSNQDSAQAAGDLFKDAVEAGGYDFTPTTGSDLIDNGLEYGGTGTMDIGAVQQEAGGGSASGARNPLRGPIS